VNGGRRRVGGGCVVQGTRARRSITDTPMTVSVAAAVVVVVVEAVLVVAAVVTV